MTISFSKYNTFDTEMHHEQSYLLTKSIIVNGIIRTLFNRF